MICETCVTRPATVHVTEQQEGLEGESHLCEECARAAGLLHAPPPAPCVRRLRERHVGDGPLLRAVRMVLLRHWRNRGCR